MGDEIPQGLAELGGTFYSSCLPQHSSFILSVITTSQKSQNWKGPTTIIEANFQFPMQIEPTTCLVPIHSLVAACSVPLAPLNAGTCSPRQNLTASHGTVESERGLGWKGPLKAPWSTPCTEQGPFHWSRVVSASSELTISHQVFPGPSQALQPLTDQGIISSSIWEASPERPHRPKVDILEYFPGLWLKLPFLCQPLPRSTEGTALVLDFWCSEEGCDNRALYSFSDLPEQC